MYQLLELLLNISVGQGGRDDFKLRALKLFGMLTYTIDDKHDSVQTIHAHTNFCIPGDVVQAIVRFFGPDIVFESGELDFFFSPVI